MNSGKINNFNLSVPWYKHRPEALEKVLGIWDFGKIIIGIIMGYVKRTNLILFKIFKGIGQFPWPVGTIK